MDELVPFYLWFGIRAQLTQDYYNTGGSIPSSIFASFKTAENVTSADMMIWRNVHLVLHSICDLRSKITVITAGNPGNTVKEPILSNWSSYIKNNVSTCGVPHSDHTITQCRAGDMAEQLITLLGIVVGMSICDKQCHLHLHGSLRLIKYCISVLYCYWIIWVLTKPNKTCFQFKFDCFKNWVESSVFFLILWSDLPYSVLFQDSLTSPKFFDKWLCIGNRLK